MNFSIGPLSFNFNKKTKMVPTPPSLSDIRAVNDDHVRYLKALPQEELKARMDDITFRNLSDIDSIQKCLKDKGIVVVTDFIKPEVIVESQKTVAVLVKTIDRFLKNYERINENDNILLQRGTEKLSGYNELSSYRKTVVQVREGQDQGMIDVFNVDIAFPELSILRKAYEDSGLKNIISSKSFSVNFNNLNFYLNRNVTSTRGFHADSYTPQLKAFVYLTDCKSLADGPYTYVCESHREGSYRRLNQELCSNLPNKTETPLLNREDIIPVIANRGSLVVSDQSGFHRGFPQTEGHKRVISVMNIK